MLLKKLRDIWDAKTELSMAWEYVIQEADMDGVEPVETLADALEQITVADLLTAYPEGFAVGPMAGLYRVLRPLGYNDKLDTGTLLVRKIFKSD